MGTQIIEDVKCRVTGMTFSTAASSLNNRKQKQNTSNKKSQPVRLLSSPKSTKVGQRGQAQSCRGLQGKRQNADVMVMVCVLGHMVQVIKNFWFTDHPSSAYHGLHWVLLLCSSWKPLSKELYKLLAQVCPHWTQKQIRNMWLTPLPFSKVLVFPSSLVLSSERKLVSHARKTH